MPTYTYRREDGTVFDYRQSFNDAPLETCPTTGQPVTRVIQAAGIIFKGSGFYVNDSKNGKNSALTPGKTTENSTPAADTASTAKPETTETKPAKTESAAK